MRTIQKFKRKKTIIVSIIIFVVIWTINKVTNSNNITIALLFMCLYFFSEIRDYDTTERYESLKHKLVIYKNLVCSKLKEDELEFAKNEYYSEYSKRGEWNDAVQYCMDTFMKRDKKLICFVHNKKHYDTYGILCLPELKRACEQYYKKIKSSKDEYKKRVKHILDRLSFIENHYLDYVMLSELIEVKQYIDWGVYKFGIEQLGCDTCDITSFYVSIMQLRDESQRLSKDIVKYIRKFYKVRFSEQDEFEYIFT